MYQTSYRAKFSEIIKDILALSSVIGILWAVTLWSSILGSGAL
jgi:hypothetical protein